MKAKLSLSRIHYLENAPHIEWIELSNGLKVQGTWELNVGNELIKRGYSITRPKLKYDGHHHYTPDFYIESLNVYIEVKGWLSDRDKKKYQRIYGEYPGIKIILIREQVTGSYKKFINQNLSLDLCEDLLTACIQ